MKRLLTAACIFQLFACTSSKPISTSSSNTTPGVTTGPKAEREFRAAWVATVANINWPSKPGLPADVQQKEAIELLDYLKNHNFNAVIFQVRPQADALYKSDLEPWSYYLSGKQGEAPTPYYDPLTFWVDEAHKRGLELHVWLNPYRSHHKDGKEITEKSIVKTKPDLNVYLKEGYWWMDPSKKGTQDHSTAVVMDIVKRYDIDGVHFDDYFYPYPSYNLGADFPDSASYVAYQAGGGKLSRGDWRRESVNVFIENLYKKIKAEKPFVKFGLSPFGIWRPGYPESVSGFDQYDQLFADAKLWLNKGWIDYFAPQLYWPIQRAAQSFPALLGWWQEENTMQRHLWPGISVGRDTGVVSVNETINQIMITRGMIPKSKGVIHWSISSDTKNPVLSKNLLNGVYRRPALVPASAWLDNDAPSAPNVSTEKTNQSLKINWTHNNMNDVFRWVVYYKYADRWDYNIVSKNNLSHELALFTGIGNQRPPLTAIAVTAVDRTGNESVVMVKEVK
jgi:uncharacterized lipoprotein YddW (UPF0748 family)